MMKREETWQKVKSNKKSNSNKLMQETMNYVKLNNAFSSLTPSIDPGTITENKQKDSPHTNNQTKNDPKKKELTKWAK